MGLSPEPPFSLATLSLICFGLFLQPAQPTSDSALVYKYCANQTFADPTGSYSQVISSFFQELIAHSSQSTFFKTTVGGDEAAISGLFQCIGNLSNGDCYNCVSTLTAISDNLCGESVAARIQLAGCSMNYEADGFEMNISDSDGLLYKACGELEAALSGLEGMRNKAFAEMEANVQSNEGFYFVTMYETLQVIAQCEEDLETCECGECVSKAVEISGEECGRSVSGQFYLDKCFMSYTYHPNGTSGNTNAGKRGGNNTGKVAAIVAGGAAALGLGFIFLKFFKSLGTKDADF